MSTLEQIVACFIGLVITGEVTAIILLLIHIHRESHKKDNPAAQERRTIVDRIERLQRQFENSQGGVSYFIFNHTRNEIVEQLDGHVTREGGFKITGEPPKIDPKFVAKDVRVLVILKDGEEAEIF